MTPAEAAATALAPLVRKHGLDAFLSTAVHCVYVYDPSGKGLGLVAAVYASEDETARLAALLRGEQEAPPVFDQMGLDPLPPFPSVRKE